ncbi:membrane integrity-associated transporter subunit PqiC [Yoonia sp. SS1-5]|uniref:Membrane integrity-associated transporter subunit PqiC n=1 Tax=Yoonia rhodophyticola TaxID=3137370 RepID=A0AAN0M769_9RHOB
MLRPFLIMTVLGLAACSPPPERLAMRPVQSALELRPLVGSAMVRTVTLPTYAAVEEIAFETPNGLIASNEDILWADDPQRAVTIAITRNLSDILNTNVGPDPWPFIGLPDVAIDIQVERMLAGANGTFSLTGQFYVGGDGIDYRNISQPFSISKPMADSSLGGVADAQAAALLDLSERIARTLGR